MLESLQSLKSRPLFRALGLLWSRMGRARFYVFGAALLLVVLAAVGLVHLFSSDSGINRHSAGTGPGPAADVAPLKEALIAITEIGLSETRGRNGQKNVAVKIGVAPRPNIGKGEVEIRVAFFDLTETNEMRPTDAEVNYEWLTAVRDWTDPAPKYLVATYEGTAPGRKSADKLRYGGFVVRVYFDGQLQAERSEPKELVAALRNNATPSSSRAAVVSSDPRIAVATPSPTISQTSAMVPPSASSFPANRESSLAIPYASPVPDKPGFVYSPHDPKFLIDVRGFPPGTEVNDPNTGKLFKVP
jgi:hypothetical protein